MAGVRELEGYVAEVASEIHEQLQNQGLLVAAFDGHGKRVRWEHTTAINVKICNRSPYYAYSIQTFAKKIGMPVSKEEAQEIEAFILRGGRKRAMAGKLAEEEKV